MGHRRALHDRDVRAGWLERRHAGPPSMHGGSAPQIYSQFDFHDYWSGIRMHLPGDGDFTVTPMRDGALRPTDGGTWRWYTREHHRLSCLPATRNGYPGQGFVAVDQDGTRYTFDVGLERYSAAVSNQGPPSQPHFI